MESVYNDFEFVSLTFPFYKKNTLRIVKDRKITEYCDLINNKKIEHAEIILPDLKILSLCPNLIYLNINPSIDAPLSYDFSPLYNMPLVKYLRCNNHTGDNHQYLSEIDYGRVNGLEFLSFDANIKSKNYQNITTLKSMVVYGYVDKNRDISNLFTSMKLDTLSISESKIYSLNGIENSQKMQCLYLYYNKSLSDISALSKVKKTLKALRIENCPKIGDFSVLGELENLELLELTGRNELPDLSFLKNMKNLKTLTFNMNVLDGDLSYCKNLSYVYSEKDRKHYNLKDSELPKGVYIRGNETIEEWRRLE